MKGFKLVCEKCGSGNTGVVSNVLVKPNLIEIMYICNDCGNCEEDRQFLYNDSSKIVVIEAGKYDELPIDLQNAILRVKNAVNRPIKKFKLPNLESKIRDILQ